MKGNREKHQHNANDDLRTLILDAARDLFISGGYDNLSMRKIAERIGHSPAAIYRHFKDREAIVCTLCHETLTMVLETFQDLADAETDACRLLRKALLSYLQFGLRVQEQSGIAVAMPHGTPGELRAKRTGLRLYRLLRDTVQQCMKENAIQELDPDLVTQGLWAVAYGYTTLAGIDTFPWKDRTELGEHLVEIQMKGLAD